MEHIELKEDKGMEMAYAGAAGWREHGPGQVGPGIHAPLFAHIQLPNLAPADCEAEALVILSGSEDHDGSRLTLVFIPRDEEVAGFSTVEVDKDLPTLGRKAAIRFAQRHLHGELTSAEVVALGFVFREI